MPIKEAKDQEAYLWNMLIVSFEPHFTAKRTD
jgi:hypothetical protein